MSASTPNIAVDPDRPTAPTIAVGILQNPSGHVLIARRPEGVPAAGLWEFPGGKLAPGESVAAGLARELEEEIGVTPRAVEGVLTRPAVADQPHLHFLRVTAWQGSPRGREGQPLAWVAPEQLADWPMPAANAPVVRALQLPDRYVITPSPTSATPAGRERFLTALERVAARGLVQLRAPDLEPAAYRALAIDAVARVHAVGGRLLLNAAPALAEELGADGVHLNRQRLAQWAERPLGNAYWVGASCHDPEQLARAADIGADFAVLSPVRATTSHPEAEPLGWSRFADWVAVAALPIYALGGVGPDDLTTVRHYGGQGVAGIRDFWPDDLATDGDRA